MFKAESFLGARKSDGQTAASFGMMLDPDGLIVSSETLSTSWGAGLSATALGAVGTAQPFRASVAASSSQGFATHWKGQVIVRVPWTLTTQAAGAAARGTVRATLYVDGVAVITGDGAPRNLNSANGTEFVELIQLTIAPGSAALSLVAGTTVNIELQPYITTVSGTGGDTFTPTLRHDPQEPDDQLVFEFTGFWGQP